jgi:hypothetical protein
VKAIVMNFRAFSCLLAASLALAACAPTYTLVPPATIGVAGGAMKVTPGQAWNRVPKGPFDIALEENWTQNGPLLDSVGFIGGLPDGQAIAKQRRKEDRKVPLFRADMTPQDIASMIESYYRIKAGATVFEARGAEPATFLGKPALRFDYDYVAADEVRRRGRAVAVVVAGKLYMATLDGTALHYFDAALPDFDRMVATAAAG